MSAMDLQTQGCQAYARGDFHKALEYFNRALDRQQTVQLYDRRAATYEKLNDTKKALQDAKAAIRAGDGDPAGYLRAGRILVKLEKARAALDIYAYGLKHVKHVGQRYEQLKGLHDDLLAQLAPTNSVDPLTVLPPELAIAVFQHCTFRQRVAVCRVSRGWKTFIRSEPTFWSHLDLTAAQSRSKVKTSFVSVAINAARKKLVAATLSNLYDFDKVLTALLRHCSLESLTLARTGLQGANLVSIMRSCSAKLKLKELRILPETPVTQSTLTDAAAACRGTLELLHCSSLKSFSFTIPSRTLLFPRLKELSLTVCQTGHVIWGLEKFLWRAPELTSLTVIIVGYDQIVGGNRYMIDLRETKIENLHLDPCLDIVLLPATIKTLRLVKILAEVFLPDAPAEDSLQLRDLPNLVEVHLSMAATTIDSILAQFETNLPPGHDSHNLQPLSNLRSLSLHHFRIAGKQSWTIPHRLKQLHSLALRDIRDLSDEHIVAIVKELPMLRSLDVSGSQITGAGIGDLLKLGQLQELVLNDCHKIGHRDAIDYARARGVRVEYKMSEESGGWKVRY